MIELCNVCAGYGGNRVLKDVSLKFEQGKITAVLGPNGSGKSTLIKTALSLIQKDSGKILLDGTDTDELDGKTLARKMSYMAQARPTPNISARKMVLHGRFPYLGYPRKYKKEDFDAADEALIKADATDIADKYLPQLSGGQRQKAYFAMVLCQNTDTVFMDEPTTYLDVEHQLYVMETARKLSDDNKAVVVVLHDLCMAMRYADEIVILNNGQVAVSGSPDEVYSTGIIDSIFNIRFRRIETDEGYRYYFEKMEKD